MGKLDSLFGKFKSDDLSYDIYRTFCHDYRVKGLSTAFLVSQFFSNLKPEFVQLPLYIWLPMIKGGKLFPETYLQPQPLPPENVFNKNTLRNLMDNYFVIFDEDEIEVSVGKKEEVVVRTQGLASQITIDTSLIKNKAFDPGTMLVVNIKLINPSPKRVEQEARAFFGNYQGWLDSVTSEAYQKPFLKKITSPELLAQRLELYGTYENLESLDKGTDFGLQNPLKIKRILDQIHSPYLSNLDLLAQEPTREIQQLTQMREWLKRDLGKE